MATLITRSFIVNMGGTPPPDLAYVLNGRVVTWAEVMVNRRARQARELEWRRRDHRGRWRPLRLSVRYYDMFIMGGWHGYLHGAAGFEHWLRYDRYKAELMKLIPLLPPLLPADDWGAWLKLFARAYQTGVADRKPCGATTVWARCTGHGPHLQLHEFALTKEEAHAIDRLAAATEAARPATARGRGRVRRVRRAAATDAHGPAGQPGGPPDLCEQQLPGAALDGPEPGAAHRGRGRRRVE